MNMQKVGSIICSFIALIMMAMGVVMLKFSANAIMIVVGFILLLEGVWFGYTAWEIATERRKYRCEKETE